jgi:hypothetical protein
MIRSEQKERAAADDLKVCKSYIQAKRYKVAYDKLRDLIKDSGRTRAAVEARVLLEEMRKKLDE